MTRDTKITIFTLLGTAVLFGTMVYAPEITDYAKMKIDGWKAKSSKKDGVNVIDANAKITITDKGKTELNRLNAQTGYYGHDQILLHLLSFVESFTKDELGAAIKDSGILLAPPAFEKLVQDTAKNNFITIS